MSFRAWLAIKLALWIGGQAYRQMLVDSVQGMIESIVKEKTAVIVLEVPR